MRSKRQANGSCSAAAPPNRGVNPGGGQSDVEARLQQPYLEKILGTKIIVEYKPGAGGALAWTQFSKAKPDGYSVCGINIPHIILQPLSQKDVAFKTVDLKPLYIFSIILQYS